MKRVMLSLTACALLLAPAGRARSSEDLARTATFVSAFQNPDGGFAAQVGGTSSLGATASAIRALKNTGGSIPDVLECIAYVRSCFHETSGGFAPTPDGTPDVRTTAVGLMAVAELTIAGDAMTRRAVEYLSRHVNPKAFEEIRIAVAGLEAVGKAVPEFPAWTDRVEAMRHPDGAFGTGTSQAGDTGGAVVTLLRMGVQPDRRDAVLTVLRSGQRPDGGWGKGEGGSDLETTYRVMRAFYMLRETPDLDQVRGFLAHCRHPDGGYAVRPGGPANLVGTYFATTVLRWVRLLGGEPALVETAGFVPLFNGRDLDGWEGDTSLWSVRDGMLVGKSPGLEHNDFLATQQGYRDFILKLTFRLVGGEGNSGVQFRSVRVPGHEMSGYQADIGQDYWGCLYDESRRNRVLEKASPRALGRLHRTGWNQYVIQAMGDTIRLTLNGVTSVKYREIDPSIARDGRIAVQMHAGGPMEVQFKDILIQPLPTPTPGDDTQPGFHLRTVKTDQGERKYTVFVPNGYDGMKTFPVALFLHGAGERGEDGMMSAQAGLGPAIYGHPDDYPMIAVFPQARTTWAANSDDARAALAALEDVLARYTADRRHVLLTGLSMGGSGSWGLAAAHPERFVAVVPVCGRGRTESAPALKSLPVWTFVGDADRDETVWNIRAMVESLRAEGGSARLTEYRGVGHNSWDRAYNDPHLIDWMHTQLVH